FEDSGRGTKTLSVELRVAHASAVVEDVHGTLGGFGESGMGAERMDNGAQVALIQFCTARRSPQVAFAGCAEDRLSGSVQSFFGVVAIQNLNGSGEQFRSRVPDPGSAIAQHRATGGFGEASARCFAQYTLGKFGPFGTGIGSCGAFNGGRIGDGSGI